MALMMNLLKRAFNVNYPMGTPRPLDKNTSFLNDKGSELWCVEDTVLNRRVYVSDVKRLNLYDKGIEHRLHWILRDYCLPHNLVRKDDIVLDVGANIGEIGIWATGLGARYLAFEPDPKAFLALQANLPTGELFQVALSDQRGMAKFYLATADADSSLFKPKGASDSIEVVTTTLDYHLEKQDCHGNIRLLKIEAEGFEPEVLAGASEAISRTEYIAIDAGPERGGENTVAPTLNLLNDAKFEIVDCFLRRGTFLLKNRGI